MNFMFESHIESSFLFHFGIFVLQVYDLMSASVNLLNFPIARHLSTGVWQSLAAVQRNGTK